MTCLEKSINPDNMKKVTGFLGIFIFLISSVSISAVTEGYVIKFRVKGIKDTTCLIANYFGNGTYVKDTVKVDGSGRFTFKAKDDLPRGIYLVVLTDKIYFEFIVNNDKKFLMETDKQDPNDRMVVTGSPENQLFYDYLRYNKDKFDEIKTFQSQQKNIPDNKDSTKLVNEKIKEVNAEIIKYKLTIVAEHPDSFVAFLINAMKEPEVPETPYLPNGRKDSTFAYRYYKEHYWDGTNFTDDRLLRTPVFYNKLKKYYDVVLIQTPDSIISGSDQLVEKSRPNKEMFKYMVWFATNHYENSEIMGFDKIFVHVTEKYYVTGQVDWINKTVLESIIKKAMKMKPLLLGSKAPNMIMMDTNNQLVSMYNIDAKFLLVLFWDPDCGHCEKEIPKIKDFYDQNKDKYGVQILAVCSDTNLVKMKAAIKKRAMNWINVDGPRTLTGDYHELYDITTTPVIYFLNSRKEIIAKQLEAEQLPGFLKNYTRMHP
jgi:thiol-disulfide isomerase/thioredoxin